MIKPLDAQGYFTKRWFLFSFSLQTYIFLIDKTSGNVEKMFPHVLIRGEKKKLWGDICPYLHSHDFSEIMGQGMTGVSFHIHVRIRLISTTYHSILISQSLMVRSSEEKLIPTFTTRRPSASKGMA